MNNIYCDPNAYPYQRYKKDEKKNCNNNITKVVYPEPYNNLAPHYDKTTFNCPCKEPPPPKPGFDIKSLLPILQGGDISKILSQLLGNNDMMNSFMPLLNGLKKNNVKKIKCEDVSTENYNNNSINNYEKIK